jgi:hypothetical protein
MIVSYNAIAIATANPAVAPIEPHAEPSCPSKPDVVELNLM